MYFSTNLMLTVIGNVLYTHTHTYTHTNTHIDTNLLQKYILDYMLMQHYLCKINYYDNNFKTFRIRQTSICKKIKKIVI